MATIKISRNHSRDDEEVREMAEELAQELKAKYGLKSKWQGDSVHFERSGLSGCLDINPGEVTIKLKMGMMMGAFAGKIEKELVKALEQRLA